MRHIAPVRRLPQYRHDVLAQCQKVGSRLITDAGIGCIESRQGIESLGTVGVAGSAAAKFLEQLLRFDAAPPGRPEVPPQSS